MSEDDTERKVTDESGQTTASSVSFGGETVKATVAKFTMSLSGFVGTILFARWLGPAEFGGFYVLLSVIRLVDRPIGGWAVAVKKRFSEASSNKSCVFGSLVAMLIGWNAIAIASAWLFAPALKSYTGLTRAPLMFSFLMAALSLLPLLSLVEATGRIGVTKWIDTVRSYLTLGLQIVFVLLGLEAAGMAFGLAAATFLTIPAALRYLDVRPSIPDRKNLVSVWEFARYSIPRSYVGQAYTRFDVLLLAYLLTPSAAANYEVAARLTLPATFVAATASSLLMPRVSELSSVGSDISTDISNALAFASIIAIPMFFGALAIPREILVTLYGPEYRGAWLLLGGLAAYRVLTTQTEPLFQALDGLDMPSVSFYVSTLALAVNIPLGIALVLEYGAIGVVLATIVAETIRYGGAAITLRRNVDGVTLLSGALVKQFGMGVVMFGAVYSLTEVVPIRSWGHLLFVVGSGAAVYWLGLVVISGELRQTVRGIVDGTAFEPYISPPLAVLERFDRP